MIRTLTALIAGAIALTSCAAGGELSSASDQAQQSASVARGFASEQGRTATWQLGQLRKLSKSIEAIAPGRPGIVEPYVVVAGFDSDPVFGREASATLAVLTRRFQAAGRAVMIGTGPGVTDPTTASGTAAALETILATVAERMNKDEDVLVLYTTSHGGPGTGIAIRDGEQAYGALPPERLKMLLDTLGITRRVVIISACYSGQFVAPLSSADTVIATASAADRNSFGCTPENDWTYFGDALINHELSGHAPFAQAAKAAFARIAGWETDGKLRPSQPQLFIGDGAAAWLAILDTRAAAAPSAAIR